jgi:hypothetical protein
MALAVEKNVAAMVRNAAARMMQYYFQAERRREISEGGGLK